MTTLLLIVALVSLIAASNAISYIEGRRYGRREKMRAWSNEMRELRQ